MRHLTNYLLIATILLVAAAVSASPLGIYEGAIKTQVAVQHYWPLNDNTVDDVKGALDATPTSTTSVSDLLGRAGKAMGFDGTNSFARVTTNGLTLGDTGTLEAWVKFDATGAPSSSKYVLSGSQSGGKYFALRNASGTTNAVAGFGSINAATIRSTSDEWRYYAFTWEKAVSTYNIKTYYSGADGFTLYPGGTSSVSGSPPTADPLYFGAANSSTATSRYDGALDNVAMYSNVLSEQGMKNHIRMASFAADPYLGQYQQTVLDTPDLIHYWPLDNLATEDVVEQIDQGNPSSKVYRAANVLGQADAAVEFNPQAAISFSENLTLGNEGTLEFWMRPDYPAGGIQDVDFIICAQSSSTSNDRMRVYIGADSKIHFSFAGDPDASEIDITGRFGEWMMGAMTWTYDSTEDEYTLIGYLSDTDGTMLATAPATISSGTAPNGANIRFGRYAIAQSHYYDGGLDEVAIYNRALTADEVLQHYNAMIPEPSTLLLLALGVAALTFIRRRRR